MDIVTLIVQEVAKLTSGFSFFHGEKEFANLEDNRNLPAVYLDEPVISEDTLKQNGQIIPTYSVRLIFGAQSDLSWDYAKHYSDCITNMRAEARQLIIQLDNVKDADGVALIESITNIRRSNFINLFDANISGCILEMNVVPLVSDPVCAIE